MPRVLRLSRRNLGRGRISAQGIDGSRKYLPSKTDVHSCSTCGKGRRRRQLSEIRTSGDGSHLTFGGEEEGGGVRSGPGVARTILLFHIISARPSKQPLRVRTFLKVYMELGS
jgi:hypothetical protein